ncbi:hypothetical protein [Paenibacillus xylaniclasticus]|uniref:hypothetical protein n=1 Tax=Paenibacillus xylaniclasticus TaxID=588083 RepID=UPI000FDBFD4B|nr:MULTISPECIES: hypothetical protein [Paenibacillus]GFN31865.1 hypothetical protein PCURB6_21250 [Paenibacillus curdlanolyticus]
MLKERRFLVGFGSGIIVGGLLLQLMITGQQEPSEYLNSDEKLYTEQEVQQLIDEAKKEAATENQAEQSSDIDEAVESKTSENPSEPAQPKQPSSPEQPSEPTAQSSNESAAAPEEPTLPASGAATKPEQPASDQIEEPSLPEADEKAAAIVIRIEPGMNLTETAELLSDKGIITSESKFIKQMKNSKKLVRAGYFVFNGQPTLEETINTITSQPLTEAQANRIKSKS